MQIKFNYNEFYINKKFQFNYNTHLSCYTTFSQTKRKAKQNKTYREKGKIEQTKKNKKTNSEMHHVAH